MPKLRKNAEQQREFNVTLLFKQARDAKGWNNKHLAMLLEMSEGQLSKIINHPLQCEIKTLLKVADKLNVKLLNV